MQVVRYKISIDRQYFYTSVMSLLMNKVILFTITGWKYLGIDLIKEMEDIYNEAIKHSRNYWWHKGGKWFIYMHEKNDCSSNEHTKSKLWSVEMRMSSDTIILYGGLW